MLIFADRRLCKQSARISEDQCSSAVVEPVSPSGSVLRNRTGFRSRDARFPPRNASELRVPMELRNRRQRRTAKRTLGGSQLRQDTPGETANADAAWGLFTHWGNVSTVYRSIDAIFDFLRVTELPR